MSAQIILFAFLSIFLSCNQTNNRSAESESKHSATIVSVQDSTIQKVVKSESEWKKELTDQEYYVLREKGTERAFTGDLWDNKDHGTYVCAGCQLPLFASDTKFKSGTGWPSYYQPLNDSCITEEADNAYGMQRVEVLCARCDGHLGHVFRDGPNPTGLRYCINSVSLDFIDQ